MAISRPRVKVPEKAANGELVEVKTLVGHPMENGRRKDEKGAIIPKNIISRFEVQFNGKLVFAADVRTGVASNPLFNFFYKAVESGEFTFTWIEDTGEKVSEKAKMTVG